MQWSDALRLFWPVLAASLLFLILGLWWRFYEAAAMERSSKPYTWVQSYRTGGFPFRRKLLGSPRLRVWALLLALLGAAAFGCGWLVNAGVIDGASPGSRFAGLGWLRPLSLTLLGTGAVYCLLNLLFDGPWVALPGALIFAAASVRGDGADALLALSLLLLLLYLREGKPGFPAELLYLGALLAMAPAPAVRPAMLWLLPCLPAVHWYKLLHQLRGRRLPIGLLIAVAVCALASLALNLLLAALLRPVLEDGLQLSRFSLAQCGPALRKLAVDATHSFAFPSPEGVAELLVDAPLLGFGLWGCCSAWALAWKRRDARGYFVLSVLAAELLLWLLCWDGAPILGLTLSTGCILHDAKLGKKRCSALLPPLAALAWYCFIHVAAWALPLAAALRERLI